jgi:hypothetical protein
LVSYVNILLVSIYIISGELLNLIAKVQKNHGNEKIVIPKIFRTFAAANYNQAREG